MQLHPMEFHRGWKLEQINIIFTKEEFNEMRLVEYHSIKSSSLLLFNHVCRK